MATHEEVVALAKKYLPGLDLSASDITDNYIRKRLVAVGGLSRHLVNEKGEYGEVPRVLHRGRSTSPVNRGKRPVGRPRKSQSPAAGEKRPVGRPRKSQSPATGEKRPVGRPRKSQSPATGEKRPVGRPRKSQSPATGEKRPVGRPKKVTDGSEPKRPVGRPRKSQSPSKAKKTPVKKEEGPKRPVGRPRKSTSPAPGPKRPVGRPRKSKSPVKASSSPRKSPSPVKAPSPQKSPTKALRSRSPLREPLGPSRERMPASFPKTPFGRSIVGPQDEELFLREFLDWDAEILAAVFTDYKFNPALVARAYTILLEQPLGDEKELSKILEVFEKQGELDFYLVRPSTIPGAVREGNILGVSHLLLNLDPNQKGYQEALDKAYEIAKDEGREEIAELLHEAGAQ